MRAIIYGHREVIRKSCIVGAPVSRVAGENSTTEPTMRERLDDWSRPNDQDIIALYLLRPSLYPY